MKDSALVPATTAPSSPSKPTRARKMKDLTCFICGASQEEQGREEGELIAALSL